MKLKQDGAERGEGGEGRTGDESGSGIHARVCRGPQRGETSKSQSLKCGCRQHNTEMLLSPVFVDQVFHHVFIQFIFDIFF